MITAPHHLLRSRDYVCFSLNSPKGTWIWKFWIFIPEKYFDMNKKLARDALDLYKKFLIRMDRVAEFLKVAEVWFPATLCSNVWMLGIASLLYCNVMTLCSNLATKIPCFELQFLVSLKRMRTKILVISWHGNTCILTGYLLLIGRGSRTHRVGQVLLKLWVQILPSARHSYLSLSIVCLRTGLLTRCSTTDFPWK